MTFDSWLECVPVESGKDQARFYEYALEASREARDWYYK